MSYPLTAILSDLHGNAPALERAIADALERGARRFVCLGDVVGYGAAPRHNLDLVMRLCVPNPRPLDGVPALEPGLCLQGNHEDALLNSNAADFNPKARAAIEWTRDELNREPEEQRRWAMWDFLSELEPAADDARAMYVHGSPRDPVREYLVPRDMANPEKMEALFRRMHRTVCFVGHSHVPAVYFEDRRLFCPRGTQGPFRLEDSERLRILVNVGSVGQPRDGDPRLSYVLFDGTELTFVRLEYDVAGAADAIRGVAELPDYLADRLHQGR